MSLGSAIRPMRPERKHALSVLPFPPPLVLPVLESCWGLVKTFLPFLISKRYSSPSSLSTNSSLLARWLLSSSLKCPIIFGARSQVRLLITVTMRAFICAQSGNKCCAVNSFSRSVGHVERRIASRMSSGNWSPVRSRCRRSRFSQVWMACERSSVLALFGGDKICLLSSHSFQLLMRHAKQLVFTIVPDLFPVQLHRQPPVLLVHSYRSRNVDPSRPPLQSHVGGLLRRSAVSCFLHSIFASFSTVCTTPTKSLAKYDQVLQLGPFFFLNRSGIKLFGSTHRMHDLVSI